MILALQSLDPSNHRLVSLPQPLTEMDLFAVAPDKFNTDRLRLKNLVLYDTELKAMLVLGFTLACLLFSPF